eukprot:scaffold87414_cov36-Prasinocladus_malaysianus.AAC.1
MTPPQHAIPRNISHTAAPSPGARLLNGYYSHYQHPRTQIDRKKCSSLRAEAFVPYNSHKRHAGMKNQTEGRQSLKRVGSKSDTVQTYISFVCLPNQKM